MKTYDPGIASIIEDDVAGLMAKLNDNMKKNGLVWLKDCSRDRFLSPFPDELSWYTAKDYASHLTGGFIECFTNRYEVIDVIKSFDCSHFISLEEYNDFIEHGYYKLMHKMASA